MSELTMPRMYMDTKKLALRLIAAPNTKDNVHLDVLSKLSVMLMDENFTTSLRNAKSVDEFLQIIDAADESAKSIDDRLSDTGITTEEKKGIRTEKGEFNRWIRATNAVPRDIPVKVSSTWLLV